MYEAEEMNVDLPELKDEDKVIPQEEIPEAEVKQVDINEL